MTKSGINTSNITIRETVRQEELTGKSAEQIKSEILTNVTTDTARENSGALKNNFDKDQVQSEINLQVDVTKKFDGNRQEVKAEINKKLDEAIKAKDAGILSPTEFEKKQQQLQNLGILVDSISAGLSAPTTSGLGIATASISPKVSYEIGQYFKSKDAEGSISHTLAHTLLGAAVAAAGGNDALTAGLSAGGAEAAAPILSKYLYGKDAKSLTADEKGTISAITGLVASGVGATTGDVSSTVQSGQVAQNAIENNRMLNLREAQVLQALIKNKAQTEKNKLYQAACYLVKCAEGVPKDDPNYSILLKLQELGAQNANEIAALKATGLYTYGNWDKANDFRTKNDEIVTRAGGAAKIVGGGVTAIGGGAAGIGLCTTGVGCAIGAPLAGVSAYGGVSTASEGKDSLFGSYRSEVGQDVLDSFNANRKDQLSPLTKDALGGAVALAEAVLLAKVGGKLSQGVKSEVKTTEKVAEVDATKREPVTNEPEANFAGQVPVRPKDGPTPVRTSQVDTPLGKHLISGEVTGRKNQKVISGGHNSDNFYDVLNSNGGKVIGSPTPVLKGITDVKYQLPNGRVETKTIYDSNVYSDKQMAAMVNEAASKAIVNYAVNGNKVQHVIVNGVTFRVPISSYKGSNYVPSAFPVNPNSIGIK